MKPRAVRLLALVTAFALVACSVLGLRHQADGNHVRDPFTGVMLHAHALSGAHVESASPDIHGRAEDHDADGAACALDTALHQAATAVAAAPRIGAPASAPVTAIVVAPRRVELVSAIWLAAPKTSPPQTRAT